MQYTRCAPGTLLKFSDERWQDSQGSAGWWFTCERFFDRDNTSCRWSTYRAGLLPMR